MQGRWLCARMPLATVDGDRPSGDVSAAAVGPPSGMRINGGAVEAVVSRRRGEHATDAAVRPGDLGPRLRRTRGSGDTGANAEGGKKQMSGSQQNGYQGQCWNCGNPGAYAGGWRMTCPGCEVSWMPWSLAPRGDPARVCWMGKIVDFVDFTRPEALGAPA